MIWNIWKYNWIMQNRHTLTESFYNIYKSIKYLFVFKNIWESWNYNVAMKYFARFDKNLATIFQLQWNIGNIPDVFLQYSMLRGRACATKLNHYYWVETLESLKIQGNLGLFSEISRCEIKNSTNFFNSLSISFRWIGLKILSEFFTKILSKVSSTIFWIF